MDDHVHVVVRLAPGTTLQKTVQNWKSFTSHELKKLSDREGAIWQAEYFARIVRNEAELGQTLHYVVGNSTKRWPEIDEYRWCRISSQNVF